MRTRCSSFGETIGLPTPWERLSRATEVADDEDRDPTVLEYRMNQKENGIQPTTMKEVRSSVGHEREAWRLAMQVEVDSLRGNQSFEVADAASLRGINHRKILPMKMVVGTKRDTINKSEKKKARCVVRGHAQPTSPHEDLHTANADITTVRAARAASVPRQFDAKVIDVDTAFLPAHLPDSF